MERMTTVILGEHPDIQMIIERRRALGQDGSDEVWEGVYYMTPRAHVHHGLLQIELGGSLKIFAAPRGLRVSAEFNLGEANDYRVPDFGVHRGLPDGLYVSTAAMIVEILSPHDKTFEKFDFYGRNGVDEILVADLEQRSIRLWRYDGSSSSYLEGESSLVLGTTLTDLQATISWP